MSRLALATALTFFPGLAVAGDLPEIRVEGPSVYLRVVPPVLQEAAVAQHLETGLTTVFAFAVESREGPAFTGGAQLSVRYDLWDEVYRLRRADARGEADLPPVRGRTGLLQWWRAADFAVGPAGARARATRLRVTLRVLPFSQAEQRDAQEWLLRSFRDAAPEAPRQELGKPPGPSRTPVRDFYGAMLASSIGRRALISFTWDVRLEPTR